LTKAVPEIHNLRNKRHIYSLQLLKRALKDKNVPRGLGRGTARRRSPNSWLRIRIGAKQDGQEKGKEKGKENEKIELIQPLFYLPFFFEPDPLLHTR
jgi:hypothetical protein